MATKCEASLTDTGRFLLEFENLEFEVVDALKELDDEELIALAQSCDLPQCIYDALSTFHALEQFEALEKFEALENFDPEEAK